ncbi:MAG: RidA family protein [Bryobacteraceae bacterium]
MSNRLYKGIAIAILAAACLLGADRKVIRPAGSSPNAPFSPAILVNGTLYVSGQVGRDPKTNDYPKEFEAEVRQTLDNIGVIMKEAGYGFQDVVAVQVYLTDMEMFQRMNSVYTTYFKEPRPARTTVGVAKLVGPARIEITVTAQK